MLCLSSFECFKVEVGLMRFDGSVLADNIFFCDIGAWLNQV